jgi:hypothetical protein
MFFAPLRLVPLVVLQVVLQVLVGISLRILLSTIRLVPLVVLQVVLRVVLQVLVGISRRILLSTIRLFRLPVHHFNGVVLQFFLVGLLEMVPPRRL